MASSTMSSWETDIAGPHGDDFVIRGKSLVSMLGSCSFAEALYLVHTGEQATASQVRVLDALMVAVMESGLSPSNVVARMFASFGVPMQVGLGAGVLAFGDWHGGAGEDLARTLHQSVVAASISGRSTEAELATVAQGLIAVRRAAGEPLPGFGHPRGGDRRVEVLLDLGREEGQYGPHTRLALALERELAVAVGQPVPINLDGVSAALLLDVGLPWQATRLLMVAPRVVGMAAHFIEELEQGHRWRHLDPAAITYTGDGPGGEAKESAG